MVLYQQFLLLLLIQNHVLTSCMALLTKVMRCILQEPRNNLIACVPLVNPYIFPKNLKFHTEFLRLVFNIFAL